MGNPKVTINVRDGGLGAQAQAEDGIAMIIVINVPQSYYDELALETENFLLVQSLADAETVGITHENDVIFDALVWEHVKDFYQEAADGSKLHVCIPVGEDFETLFTPSETTFNYTLEQYWQTQGNIKLLAVTIAQSTDELPDPNTENLVITAELDTVGGTFTGGVVILQDWIARMAALHYPLQAFIGHWNFANGAAWSAFASRPDLSSLNSKRVSVLIGTDASRIAELVDAGIANVKHSQIGLLLGRTASVGVQRNVGRVRDGALPVSIGIVAGAASGLVAMPDYVADSLRDKGYIFYQKYAGRTGFFFNDDRTASLLTSDYFNIANGRVVDKAVRIAYQALLEYLKDEVLVDPDSGRLATAFVKNAEASIENPILTQMAGEIVAVRAIIDPAQNILATSKLEAKIRVTPFGYAREIEADVALFNPLNQ